MSRANHRGESSDGTNAGRRFPPKVLSDAEVHALLDACGEGSPTHARNRALIAVLYRGGLRVSEALALYPKDLDPATGAVRVLWGKGGRARTIGLDPGAFRLVGVWMRHRAALGLDARYPRFCTPPGRGGVVIVHQAPAQPPGRAGRDRQAGPSPRPPPHPCRPAPAGGVDIGIISKQRGHRSIATTATYLDHIAPWAVVEAMRGRRW